MDITTTFTYLGLREEPGVGAGERPWKHHAYAMHLTFEGRSFDFTYKQGTAHHREPEDAWRDRNSFSVPSYIKNEPRGTNRATGLAEYPYSIRKRFHEERDAAIVAGALGSIVSDIELFDQYTDDELADEFTMKPSQIAAARVHVQAARTFLGRHVEQFINEYRED